MSIPSASPAFPTDRLDQVAFERFVAALLAMRHPEAAVRRAGKSGHKQGGLDVTVHWPDGKLCSYQCKRVRRFGPSDVAKAVNAHSAAADVKYLVLSRTASPKVTHALLSFPGWKIMDKEDLSRIIHLELSHDNQNRLVDVFFPGMRMPLLGRSEPSHWLTTSEFFAPFLRREALLCHDLPFQGREVEAARLRDGLESPTERLILLIGSGGVGKSRLLLESLTEFERLHHTTIVRLLSAAGIGSRRAGIEALGRNAKLLVVDDAHDRDVGDLLGLLEYAAASESNTRLVLAARPYAAERIARAAARFSLAPFRVEIGLPGRSEARALARAALANAAAVDDYSEQLAQLAGDCPLILVMAARLVAKQGSPVALAHPGDGFRNVVLGRFTDVMAGSIGYEVDRDKLRRVLAVLAIVQPFHVDDARLCQLIESTERVAATDVPRLLKSLEEGGVIYRRGGVHRLMPDVLADYIIEDAYVGPNHTLSPNAHRMLNEAPAGLVENVLVNLGRLDWRLSNGATAGSRLLESAWHSLNGIDCEHDPRFSAIASVAPYQPRQALQFVQKRIREGRACLNAPTILRGAAHDYDSLDEVCDLLWKIGASDTREPGNHADHPIRTLIDLCGYEDGKPLAYSERVYRWAVARMVDADAWDGVHTPLDVAAAVLGTETMKTTCDDQQIFMSASLVVPEVVRPLRRDLVNLLLAMLVDPQPRIGWHAATKLGEALRHPIGMLGSSVPDEIVAAYDAEFGETLAVLRDSLSPKLHSAVVIALARAVNWHAEHGRLITKRPARAVLEAMPTDLPFRTRLALADGFGQLTLEAPARADWYALQDERLTALVTELQAFCPDKVELAAFIESALDDLAISPRPENSTHMLLHALLRADIGFARALLDAVGTRPACRLGSFAPMALGFLLHHEPEEGRAIVRSWLVEAVSELPVAAITAYSTVRRPMEGTDLALIDAALQSSRPEVVSAALRAISSWHDADQPSVIALLSTASIGNDAGLAELFALAWCHGPAGLLDSLDCDNAQLILALLLPVPKLDGNRAHELVTGLASRFPNEVADFLIERVHIAADDPSSAYQPLSMSVHAGNKLNLLTHDRGPAVLARCWEWLLSSLDKPGPKLAYHAQNAFEMMFLTGLDGPLTSFFADRLTTASPQELRLIGQVLRHAEPNFVFENLSFVGRFLKHCALAGSDILRAARDSLFLCATMGLRSSIAGQPCPRDVETAAMSKAALRNMARQSEAKELLEEILHDAQRRLAERPRRS